MLKFPAIFLTLAFTGAVITLGSQPTYANEDGALELAWSTSIGDSYISLVPVIVDDKVLGAVSDGPLTALNTTTGKLEWTYDPKEGMWNRGVSAEGKQVFVGLRGGKFAALNSEDGTEQWKIDLGINTQTAHHISGDTVFVSTSFVGAGLPGKPLTGSKLFSINRSDGAINWAFTTNNHILQSATSFGDTVYLGGSYIDPNFVGDEGGANRFHALDRHTGEVKWVHESIDGFPKTLYATENELTYVAYEDYSYGLDAKTGEQLWRRNTANWVQALSGVGNTIYYGAANTDVFAIDTTTGQPRWVFNIGGGTFNYVLRAPAIVDDRLYFITQKGHIYAIDRLTGEEFWHFETADEFRSGVTVHDGLIYASSYGGTIYAYQIMD